LKTINRETVVEEPFRTVESVSSGTYGITRKAFISALAPTASSGSLSGTVIASSEEETSVLGVGGHEEGDEKGQKEKSSRSEHPCVWCFLRREEEKGVVGWVLKGAK